MRQLIKHAGRHDDVECGGNNCVSDGGWLR
jgi:hypothetical protein